MKRYIFGAAATVLAVALVVVGPGKLLTQLRALRNQTAQTWDAGLPDNQVKAQVQVKLTDLENQIRTYHAKVGEAADRTAAAQVKAQDLAHQLDNEKKLLVQAKALIDREQTSYVVAGRTYSRKEIDAEARLRLARCQHLEKQVESQKNLADDLNRVLEQGKANLADARRLKEELTQELQLLESRLANARIHKEVLDLATQVKESPFGPDSELSQQMEQLRSRARQAERDIEYLSGQAQNHPIVNWNGEPPAEDVGQAIARYLKADGVAPVSGK